MSGVVPRVSILMPTYNNESYLAQAIESVLGQTRDDFELIIGDNASTDGTARIACHYARRDERITYFRNDVNVGSYGNYNRCIAHASAGSQYFADLPSDDWWTPTLLEELTFIGDEHPEAALIHGDCYRVDERGQVLNDFPTLTSRLDALPPHGTHQAVGELFHNYYVHLPSSLLRRRWLSSHGFSGPLFDTTFRVAADYLLVLRIMARGATAYFHDRPVAYYRRHRNSEVTLSDDGRKNLKEEIEIFDRALGHLPGPIDVYRRQALADRLAVFAFELIRTKRMQEAVPIVDRARGLDGTKRRDLRVAALLARLPISDAGIAALWNVMAAAIRWGKP